ncbi:MAG: CoA transferase, partial [Comamonas sp.]
GSDVCFGAVMSPLEASTHPHMQARGVYTTQGGVLQAAPAPRFDGAAYPAGDMCAAGAHTDAVLAAVGAGKAGAAWSA